MRGHIEGRSYWNRTLAVFFAGLIASFVFSLDYRFGYAGWPVSVGISHGALWLGEVNTPDRGAGWFLAPNKAEYVVWWFVPGWVGRNGPGIILPLWIPISVIGMASVFRLLKSGRRLLKGHCPCGYNLHGNQSGVCPECGRPTNREDLMAL
jgi:hypothetical protein